jgi:cyanobactin cluster PatC/TenC/TruC protein
VAENDDKSKKAKSHIPKRTMKVRAMSTRPFSTGLVDYALWIYMFQDAEDTTDKNAPRGRIWS